MIELKKCGMQFVPIKPLVLCFLSTTTGSMYEHNNKRYLGLSLSPAVDERVAKIHEDSRQYMKSGSQIIDPKSGTELCIKVPYKYNKVTCKVTGLKTVQELSLGDKVNVTIQYCGVWNVNTFSGCSWKLVSIETF